MKKISALSLIPQSNFPKNQQHKYSKMVSAKKLVKEAALREGVWRGEAHYFGEYRRCTQLYADIEKYFLYPTKKTKARRHLENSFKNVLDLHREFGKKFAVDVVKDRIAGVDSD